MEKLIQISFEELTEVAIQCSCGAAPVLLVINADVEKGAIVVNAPQPEPSSACPRCGANLSNAIAALRALRDFRKFVKSYVSQPPMPQWKEGSVPPTFELRFPEAK